MADTEMGLWPHVARVTDVDNPNVGTTGLLKRGREEAPLPGRLEEQRTPISSDWSSAYSPIFWGVGVAAGAASIVASYCLWLSRLPQMDFLVYRAGGRHVFLHGGLYSSQIKVLGRQE